MLNSYTASNYLIRYGIRCIIQMGIWFVLVIGFLIAWVFFPGVRGMISVEPFPDAGPLELPAELVLGEAPSPIDWCVDPTNGGILIVTNGSGDPWNPVRQTERMDSPWKERKPARKDALDLVGGASPDGRFLARISRGKNYQGKLSVLEAETGKVLTVIEPFAVTPNPKFVVWHPKANILVAAGGDQITLVREPKWRPKTLKTASRDPEEWKRGVENGDEETGYHSNEMVSHILFSADGTRMICAIDQGIRAYSWEKVLSAKGELPPPEFAVDGEVVRLNTFSAFRMTYTAAYDDARKWILWSGIEGKLEYLDTATKARGSLLMLPRGYEITRMQFLDSGKVLACDIHKLTAQGSEGQGLFFLDYAKLVESRPQP
jgi:hypothetical protein